MFRRFFALGCVVVLAVFLAIASVRSRAADLPPRPDFDPSPPATAEANGFVTAAVQSEPLHQVPPGGEVRLTLTITNRGRGEVKDAQVLLPLDPALVQLQSISFSRETVWVSAAMSQSITIRTGALARDGDAVQSFLVLRVQPGVANGTRLIQPPQVQWDNRNGGSGSAPGNRAPLIALTFDLPNSGYVRFTDGALKPVYALQVDATQRDVIITSDMFIPGEPVVLWVNLPNGTTQERETLVADQYGAIAYTYPTTGLPSGNYGLVVMGLWSNIQALGPFQR